MNLTLASHAVQFLVVLLYVSILAVSGWSSIGMALTQAGLHAVVRYAYNGSICESDY